MGPAGRRFKMLRFRTTIHNPDDALRPWVHRTTQVGKFLQQTRIDALPQLINVLRGEMSIADTFLLD